jgi:signal-transduction protein with cAMP-binding, CBS, and nucleotidyltransferase domain
MRKNESGEYILGPLQMSALTDAGGGSTEDQQEPPLCHQSIKELYTTNPICVDARTTLRDTIKVLQDRRIGAVIVHTDNKYLGMFGERALVMRIYGEDIPMDTPVGQLLKGDPVWLHLTDDVGKAVQLMVEKKLRHLAVCSGNRQILGILSVRRIIDCLAERFPAEVINRPPRADQTMTAPEGG